jgi:hypothetical protein
MSPLRAGRGLQALSPRSQHSTKGVEANLLAGLFVRRTIPGS